MAKITQLPASAPLDGTETVPIVQGGAMKQSPLTALLDPVRQQLATFFAFFGTRSTAGTVKASYGAVSTALAYAIGSDGTFHAPALVTRSGFATTFRAAKFTVGSHVFTKRRTQSSVRDMVDSDHRLIMASNPARGGVVMPGLRAGPARGLLRDELDRLDTRVTAVEGQTPLWMPPGIARLRRAYYDAPAAVPVSPIAPAMTLAYAADAITASQLTAPREYIPGTDARYIRLLGGPWDRVGTTYIANLTWAQQNVRYGINVGPSAGNPQIEFIISPGVTRIEICCPGLSYLFVMIDGVLASQTDPLVPSPAATAGGYRSHLLTLPAATTARRIRLLFPKGATVGSIRTDATEGTLLPYTAPRAGYSSSAYFLGDSITEGSVATYSAVGPWSMQCALRLGLDTWANGGVGSSGWLQSITNRERARVRWQNILTMVDGGPPDLLICALGINDDAPGGDTTKLNNLGTAVYEFIDGIRHGVAAGAAGTGSLGPVPDVDLPGAPTMPIIVLGPFGGGTGGFNPDLQAQKRDRIFHEATKFRHVTTIDTQPWWDDALASGDVNLWYNGGANGPHPIDYGHAAIGKLAADAILPILKSL